MAKVIWLSPSRRTRPNDHDRPIGSHGTPNACCDNFTRRSRWKSASLSSVTGLCVAQHTLHLDRRPTIFATGMTRKIFLPSLSPWESRTQSKGLGENSLLGERNYVALWYAIPQTKGGTRAFIRDCTPPQRLFGQKCHLRVFNTF